MGWTVRGLNPGEARFSACPDRPWGPLSVLYNGYLGIKYGQGLLLPTQPHLVPWSWKSRAIPLPALWATTWPVTRTLYLTCSGVGRMVLDPNQRSATIRIQQQFAMGWTVRGSDPGGCEFSLTRIDRP